MSAATEAYPGVTGAQAIAIHDLALADEWMPHRLERDGSIRIVDTREAAEITVYTIEANGEVLKEVADAYGDCWDFFIWKPELDPAEWWVAA